MKINSRLKSKVLPKTNLGLTTLEKSFIFAALFCFAFGLGLISDGIKLYSYQLKVSQRVDYHATQNPFPQN